MTDKAITLTGKAQMEMFHLLQMKHALSLECKGMKNSRGSVYAYTKKLMGFKGNKQRVYDQLVKYIEDLKVIQAQINLVNPVNCQKKV